MALEREIAVFEKHILELLPHEGQYAVVCGEDVRGPYETYEKALEAGYGEFGLTPFLVRQIFEHQPIEYFSRDLNSCRS